MLVKILIYDSFNIDTVKQIHVVFNFQDPIVLYSYLLDDRVA